ncbi:MAG: exodeoxyribonuclease VII small subunit [Tepidisphaeraceae bacterium]
MSKKNHQQPKNYEDAEHELNQILSEIEGGEISLEDSLVKYERGMFLLQYCRSVLDRAEKQIELLSKTPDGSLQAQPENGGGENA